MLSYCYNDLLYGLCDSCPLIPVEWKRFRDDTWDIEENVDEKDLVQFTEYMNTMSSVEGQNQIYTWAQ